MSNVNKKDKKPALLSPTVTEEEFFQVVFPEIAGSHDLRRAQIARWAGTGRVVANQDNSIDRKYLDSELARKAGA